MAFKMKGNPMHRNYGIGSPNKMKDLSGDGKVTKKDVLIGRGVLDKDGSPLNKYGSPMNKNGDPKKKSTATAGTIVGDIDNKLGDAMASGNERAAKKAFKEVKNDINSVLNNGGKEAESLNDLINVNNYKNFNTFKKAYEKDQ